MLERDRNFPPESSIPHPINPKHINQVLSNFRRALSVYNCKEYSRIWGCDNCTAVSPPPPLPSPLLGNDDRDADLDVKPCCIHRFIPARNRGNLRP